MPRVAYIVGLFLLVALQYRLWLAPSSIPEVRTLAAQVSGLALGNAELAARNQRLEAAVRQLERDPAAIEFHARMDLGMIRPGESFYLIVH